MKQVDALMSLRRKVRLCAVMCAGLLQATALGAATVDVVGLDPSSELRGAITGGSLLLEQTLDTAQEPSSFEILTAAQADYKRLLAVLYDAGHFASVIKITLDGREAASFPPVSPPLNISRVVIDVTPGPQFKFGRTDMGPLAEGTQVPDTFAQGEVARLSTLKDAVEAGVNGWRDQGHAKAALIRQDLAAQHAENTLSADLGFDPGPKLRFGQLDVPQDGAVRARRITQIAGLPTGKIYAPKELERATERLRRAGAFSAVALIEAERIGPNDTLDITAQLTDAAQRRFGFGAELSTVDGATLSAFWLHRNLFGGAERLRVEAEISGIDGETGGADYRFSTRFERPATFNEDTDFYALAQLKQLDEIAFFSRQLDLEAGIIRYATQKRTYRLGLGLRRAETRDTFGTRRYTLLTLPIGVKFDYRDAPLDAKNGYYADVNVMPFLALSGSDDGLRSYVDLRAYKTFGTERPVTLALRGQLGSVFGPSISEAPADYLFYSGGGGTVRGQPYQSLGVNVGGNTVGGRSFAGLSAEVRFQATKSIGLVGFADAGYVGAEEFYDGNGEWHSGAGLGVRYATGIGPIRFDVAVPTSGPATADNFQVYIGIGQSF